MLEYLACIVFTAAITSIIVESPLNRWLRIALADSPTDDDYQRWREAGADEASIPKPKHEWLDKGLNCAVCVSFWVSAAVCLIEHQPAFTWGLAWLGGRLLLGVVRYVEEGS